METLIQIILEGREELTAADCAPVMAVLGWAGEV